MTDLRGEICATGGVKSGERRRPGRQPLGVQTVGADPRPRLALPALRARARRPSRRRRRQGLAGGAEIGERHRPVALGQAFPSGPEDERDVRPGRPRQPEQVAEEGLPGGRRQQVVAANDLPHSLIGVVDDHGEVVGEGAVAAPQDQIVDRFGALAARRSATVTSAPLGAESQARTARPPLSPPLRLGRARSRQVPG